MVSREGGLVVGAGFSEREGLFRVDDQVFGSLRGSGFVFRVESAGFTGVVGSSFGV